MILSHFSKEPFEFDPKRKYSLEHKWAYKPKGLWLSHEDPQAFGWREWCEGEEFGLERLKYRSDFECDLTYWAVLRTSDEILSFSKEYGMDDPSSAVKIFKMMDWPRVVKEFSGLLITPYNWSLRLHPATHWYYGWDCASACCWNLKTVRPLVTK